MKTPLWPAAALLLCFGILLQSCFKDDERITPHVPGSYITDTVKLTGSYKYQVYYDLASGAPVLSHLKTSWDLGFENSASGWKIVPNSSCFMKTAFVQGKSFGQPLDTTGLQWIFNPSDGSADSITFGRWFQVENGDTVGNQQVTIIDRGQDEAGIHRGLYQFVADSLSGGVYYFRLAKLDGSQPMSYHVTKTVGTHYTLFSIDNPQAAISEAPAADYDLLFTQYTTLLFTDAGVPYPYIVTGVLLAPDVAVGRDTVRSFADIDFASASTASFSQQRDAIGYDWKKYDMDAGTYTLIPNRNYIIRGRQGFYYKLRFVGFTDRFLERGFISFEYQRL